MSYIYKKKKIQWFEHRWLVYLVWFELVFEPLGVFFSDRSNKQIFRDSSEKVSDFIMNMYVVCTQ